MSAIVRRVTATEAVVRTATVEIKTLTISGKQVTLAVFRQLPERALVDSATIELAGVPWGRVNYHPDPWCKEAGTHVHVVWQSGDVLYRSAVTQERPYGAQRTDKQIVEARLGDWHRAVRGLACAAVLAAADGADPVYEVLEQPAHPGATGTPLRLRVGGLILSLQTDYDRAGGAIVEYLNPPAWERNPQTRGEPVGPGSDQWRSRPETEAEVAERLLRRREHRRDGVAQHLAAEAAGLGYDPAALSVEDWAAEVGQATVGHARARDLRSERDAAWVRQYETLLALDQLYIAV